MDDKLHSRTLQQQLIIHRKTVLIISTLLFFLYLMSFTSTKSLSGQRSTENFDDPYSSSSFEQDSIGDGDGEEEEKPTKKKEKKVAATPVGEKRVHATESMVYAGDFSLLYPPMEKRSRDQVICPNVGSGGKNKECSRGYVEYHFNVSPGSVYYLYVEAIGPTIMDNSLWVGASDKSDLSFLECSSKQKAGPVVPHKHVSKGKWLCCPKYLAKNAKKGQASFYSDCCHTLLGPKGDETACVLDLEVDTKPHWNQVPRKFTASTSELGIKLYAREDGTAITRLYLSTQPELTLDQLS